MCIRDSADGEALRALLAAAGVRTEGVVVDPGRPTATKQRVVATDQLLVRYDTGPTDGPSDGAQRACVAALDTALLAHPGAAVVVADYGRGAPGPSLVGPALRAELARRRGDLALLVVDAHHLAPWAALRPDLVTPNVVEAAALLGEPAPVADRIGALLSLIHISEPTRPY